MWQDWINGILGLWLILSAFVGMSVGATMANLVIVGIVVAALGFWAAGQRYQQSNSEHQHA